MTPVMRWHTPRARPAAQAQTPALTGELTPTGLTALALTLVLALLPALAMGLVLAPAMAASLALAFVDKDRLHPAWCWHVPRAPPAAQVLTPALTGS